MKNFEFRPIENQGIKPTLKPNEGMARSYKEFKAVVVRRYSTYWRYLAVLLLLIQSIDNIYLYEHLNKQKVTLICYGLGSRSSNG